MLVTALISVSAFALAMGGLSVGLLGGRQLQMSCGALLADCTCGCDEASDQPPRGQVTPLIRRRPDQRLPKAA